MADFRRFSLAMTGLAALSSTSVLAADKDIMSWGKAGVTLETYKADAVTCGREGYYLDIANTQPVADLKKASSQLDHNEADIANSAMTGDLARTAMIAGASAHIVEAVRPAARMAEIRKLMDEAVTACLVKNGYARFRLTTDQKKQLQRLKRGSAERRAYLHSLASDPAVLASQAL